MSIKHRKSLLFDKPNTTIAELKIASILTSYKQKLQICNRSKGKPANQQHTLKLSLNQAKKLQNLHQTTRQGSLNNLLNSYHRNSVQIIPSYNTIDKQKLDLFHSGVYYRSTSRAKGVGVAKMNKQSLKQYYQRQKQENAQSPIQQEDKKYNTIDLSSSNLSSFRSVRLNRFSTIKSNFY